MPVPKRKRSRARRDSRFANKGIQVKPFTTCKNCTVVTLPHQVCKNCGYYKGIKVVTTKAERTLRRRDAQQARAPEQTNDQASSAGQE